MKILRFNGNDVSHLAHCKTLVFILEETVQYLAILLLLFAMIDQFFPDSYTLLIQRLIQMIS